MIDSWRGILKDFRVDRKKESDGSSGGGIVFDKDFIFVNLKVNFI